MKRSAKRRQAPITKAQIIAVLPTLAIAALVSGYLLYIMLALAPEVRAANAKVKTLNGKRRQLVEQRQVQRQRLPTLREKMSAIQGTLVEKQGLLLNKALAAEAMDRLYQYADENEVVIVDLQNRPTPQKPKNTLYDLETFRLRVQGELPHLLRFVAQVKENIPFPAFVLDHLNITTQGESHLLTVDIALYTSIAAETQPLSSSATLSLQVTPVLTLGAVQTALPTTPATTQPTPPSDYPVRPTSWPTQWPWPPRRMQVASPVPSALPTAHYIHVVQEGETLLQIALRYNSSVEAIIAANNLEGGTFYVGQQLQIPVYGEVSATPPPSPTPTRTPTSPPAAAATPALTLYTVRRGDTLSGLATRFGSTVRELMALNDLANTRIYVGQQLKVPVR